MTFSEWSISPDAIIADYLGFPKILQANDGNVFLLAENLFLKNPLPSIVVSVTT